MKLEKTSTHVFRLMGVYDDETAFILPLQTPPPSDAARMLSVSTREPLIVVGAQNAPVLRGSAAFAGVEQRCSELVRAYMNSIHVLVAAPDTDTLVRGGTHHDDSPTSTPQDDVGELYDEIDDIYRYVRQGGEPPAPRSPPQTAANTSTDAEGRGTGAAYNWEEPIYEDIEKIRQRKRQRATTTEPAATTTTTTTSTTTTTTTAAAADDNRLHHHQEEASVDVMPIGNLRQLIKRFSMLESSSTCSKPRPAAARRLNRTAQPGVPAKLTVDTAVSGGDGKPAASLQGGGAAAVVQRASHGEYVEQTVSVDLDDDDLRRTTASQHHVDHDVPRAAPQHQNASQPQHVDHDVGRAASQHHAAAQPQYDTSCQPAHHVVDHNVRPTASQSRVLQHDLRRTAPQQQAASQLHRDSSRHQSPNHVDATPPPAPAALCSADDTVSTRAGGVTSVRVRDVGRRQPLHDAAASSPYFCSRVAVGGGGSTMRSGPQQAHVPRHHQQVPRQLGQAPAPRQFVVDTQPASSVTRITTLSRNSARRHDVHQQTA